VHGIRIYGARDELCASLAPATGSGVYVLGCSSGPYSPKCGEGSFSALGCLKLEPLRSERLPEPCPGGLDELRIAYDLPDLRLGAVATHVIFLEYLLQGRIALVHAFDDVPEDPLLALRERRGFRATEEPLPKGSSLADLDLRRLRCCLSLVGLTLPDEASRSFKKDYSPECVEGVF
jgi:hypothetical protein